VPQWYRRPWPGYLSPDTSPKTAIADFYIHPDGPNPNLNRKTLSISGAEVCDGSFFRGRGAGWGWQMSVHLNLSRPTPPHAFEQLQAVQCVGSGYEPWRRVCLSCWSRDKRASERSEFEPGSAGQSTSSAVELYNPHQSTLINDDRNFEIPRDR